MARAIATPAARTSFAEALRLVVEGTVSGTGVEFFRALVRNLATALGTSGAWVTEYNPATRRLKAFALWLDGRFVDGFEYAIEGTACHDVVESRSLVHIPDRVMELYPGDPDLRPAGAVSYLGTVLTDPDGSVIGHLAVLDRYPMPADPQAISLFEVFAARAAGELRRLRAERELRAREEELALLFETARDAIVVFDERRTILRTNEAAHRLFGCTAEDLVGERLDDFLPADGAARVEAFVREIAGRPKGRQHLWVPEDFVVRRWDRSVFPAEITLSRFERAGGVYYTIILRNCDERVQAAREIERLNREAAVLREAVNELPGFGELLGRCAPMRALFDVVKQVAGTDATVLIVGETGTGKELVARSIHQHSARAKGPMICVNCAALPGNLIESECFGHERGAFTGAATRREGRFALAHGGTLFLDEIGEMPLELQAKLLRVLQEGTFEPLGSSRTVKVDVRVVVATHRDLRQMVAEGKFRQDLYFRLNVFPVHVPPLRERGSDIGFLARALCERLARRMGKRLDAPTEDDIALLERHSWPGNVRELQNVIERAIILATDRRPAIARAMVGTSLEPGGTPPEPRRPEPGTRVLSASEFEELERQNLRRALELCGGRISGSEGAAALIGVPPSTLSSRLKALGLARAPRS